MSSTRFPIPHCPVRSVLRVESGLPERVWSTEGLLEPLSWHSPTFPVVHQPRQAAGNADPKAVGLDSPRLLFIGLLVRKDTEMKVTSWDHPCNTFPLIELKERLRN